MADLLNILVLASIYGLYASGFTLVFGLFDILNIAHAAVFAFGAILAMFLVTSSMPLWLAAPAAIFGATLAGVLIERVAFRPIRYRARTAWGHHTGPLVTSLGAATVLEGLETWWFGIDPRHFPEGTFTDFSFQIVGSRITLIDITSIGLLLLTFGGVWALIKYTRWGLEVRAVADAPQTAPLFGIDVERRIIQVFALASALGGIAGLIWGLAFNMASPATASQVDMRGFAIITLGGMGSVPGALIGALFLASAEVLSVLWLPSSWQSMIGYGTLFLMLLIRPQGILGKKADIG